MRTWLTILSLLTLTPGWDGPDRLPLLGKDTRITVTRLSLDPGDATRKRVGRLTYLGGVRLDSADPVFGGFSAMHVDGERFTLFSDGGNIVRFRLDAHGRLSDASFAALPGGPGTGWPKSDRDSESVSVDPVTGDFLIGLESTNQLWRYSADLKRALGWAKPVAMADWPKNGGAETMVRLADGSIVVVSETGRPTGKASGRAAVRFMRDPTLGGAGRTTRPQRFTYRPPDGYDPSDAALLPDGRIVVLNRRFALPFDFSTMLTIVDTRRIKPGALVRGTPIATFAAPLTQDNFEGVTVTREGADTILWLVTDDNQLFLERTLLMKFRLDPPR